MTRDLITGDLDTNKIDAFIAWHKQRWGYWTDNGACRERLEVWQASRRAALEEAAKVCDELADSWNQTAQGATDGRYDFMAEAGDRCSDEIRALTSP